MDQSISTHDTPEKHQLLASKCASKPRTEGLLVHEVPCSSADNQSSASCATEEAQWTPFATRWYFVIVPASLSVALALLVMILHWLSVSHSGIASERSAIAGWKFIPTLIAVVYTQLAAMVLGALKRTEPFARLARSIQHVPIARYTLLEKSKPWWTTLAHGFQKRRNPGFWSREIILSSVTFILAILGISPLSAALLSTKDVELQTTVELTELVLDNASGLLSQSERSTFLRTTGALLQNYSTSPWAADDYFILPFWPGNNDQAQWEFTTLTPQTWEAETTIFHNDFVCNAFEFRGKDVYLRHAVQDFEVDMYNQTYLASVLLETNEGCRLNLTYNATSNPDVNSVEFRRYETFASWTDIRKIASRNAFDLDARVILNDDCPMDEMILMSTPWMTQKVKDALLPNTTITAYACRSDHTMARLPVRASSTTSSLTLEFDKERFSQIREPVPEDVLDHESLHKVYSSPEWFEYLPQPLLLGAYITGDNPPPLHGGAALLGTKYDFNITTMMSAGDLPQEAARMRRRFFSETLRTSLDSQQDPNTQRVVGTRVASDRRILVNKPIAVALCVLLSISFFNFAALIWLCRPRRRPLHLHRDPSSILGLYETVSTTPAVLGLFKSLDLAPRGVLKAHFGTRTFASSSRALHEVGSTQDSAPDTSRNLKSPASVLPALRLRNLLGLLAYVLALLIATVVLFKFARTSTLRQTFFVYRANIQLFGDNASFSPFAIVPTLLAIGITLWWDSIDQACRALQPYLAMSHNTEPPSHGIGLSYASSFWLWASVKAVKNRHWLLSLVTLTTFMMQALTISMSALFQQNSVSMPQIHALNRSLEVRRVPLLAETFLTYGSEIEDAMFYENNVMGEVGIMLAEALSGLEGNWLYTALLQASLQGPEPAWSSDGWSFVPLDLSSLTEEAIRTSASETQQHAASAKLVHTTNLTVQTTALRGRVECSMIKNLEPDMWLSRENGTKNLTAFDHVYYPHISLDFGNSTSQVTPMAATPECCYNATDPKSSLHALDMYATLAYWTENQDSNDATTKDFSVKWIRGKAGFMNVGFNPLNPRMTFAQPPAVQALNCVPIFETADVEVTVEPNTGIVQNFNLLQEPVSDAVAWSDNFQIRRSNETYEFHNSTEERRFYHNVTTSYGTLFMKSLLRAACLENWNYGDDMYYRAPRSDYPFDKVFNMRDNSTGLNVDFMSYAALAQANHDPAALLDPDVLLRETKRVFSIFFQHYVSGTVSLDSGGWAYQPIGSNPKLPEPIPHEALKQPPSKFEDFPLRSTKQAATATLYMQTEVLQMNTVAVWVSVSILLWLVATIVIFAAMQRRYLGGMQRNIECIADALVLIAGSERLLRVIDERGIDAIVKDDSILTRLGWFRDDDGIMRWRIELVEDEHGQARPVSLGNSYSTVPRDEMEEEGTDRRSSRPQL